MNLTDCPHNRLRIRGEGDGVVSEVEFLTNFGPRLSLFRKQS
jgi:hypothetical protein